MVANIRFTDTLYGRDVEKEKLLNLLMSAAANNPASIFISGSPGTGKTFLAKSIINETQDAGGIFVTGKFDQYKRDLPYSAFRDALINIVKSLLLYDEAALKEIKKRIISSLQPNIRIIIDIVPELELITGKQPLAPDIDQGNASARFKHCLAVFLAAVSACSKPLVIFIDDIQWADTASIDILRYLIEISGIKGLFLIFAYRDNEIGIDRILSKTDKADILNIQPLQKKFTEEIVYSALEDHSVKLKRLASLIYKKTSGNPFFVRRFLQILASNGSLQKDAKGQWLYNEQDIDKVPVMENVAELIAAKIRMSPPQNSNLLSTAACIGACFETELLGIVADISDKTKLSGILRHFVREDYLIRESHSQYVFTHDKVQEAAYGLLLQDEKAGLHWKIGNTLLKTNKGKEDAHIFAIADHLNMSGEIPKEAGIVKKQININFTAGLKARASVAYNAAISYFGKALLLTNANYRDNSRLLFKIRKNYAECVYLSGDFEQAEAEIYETMRYTTSAIEIAELYNTLVFIKNIQCKYYEAIDCGIKAMDGLGFFIEKSPSARKRQAKKLNKIAALYLKDITVDKIVNLPQCREEKIRHALTLLLNIGAATFHLAEWDYCHFFVTLMIVIIFENGISSESCTGFSCYAYLSEIYENYNLSCVLGKAAWILANKYMDLNSICFVSNQYANYVIYLDHHLKESIPINKAGLDAGLKSGSRLFVAYCITHSMLNMVFLGTNIESALKNLEQNLEYLLKLKDDLQINIVKAIRINLLKLADKITGKSALIISEISKKDFESTLYGKKLFLAIEVFYNIKMIVLYIYGDYNGVLYYYKRAKEYEKYILGFTLNKEYYFYYSITISALYSSAAYDEQVRYIEELAVIRAKLKALADQSPDNFLARHLLIEAESARINSDFMRAMSLYDRAINSARTNDFKHIEAIACERAAVFWLGLGKKDFASLYLKRAYTCFLDWGASGKLESLRSQYPDIFSDYPEELDGITSEDVLGLLKAFNALSVHIDIADLLKELTYLALQYSEAELFALIMEDEGNLMLQAYGTSDLKNVQVMQSTPLDDRDVKLPVEMIRYIQRTRDNVLVYDEYSESIFSNIPYMKSTKPISAMCLKVETATGAIIWYVENSTDKRAFSKPRKALLEILAKQAGICIQNVFYNRKYKNIINSSGFSFKINRESKVILYDSIIYFSSHSRNSIVHTTDRDYEIPVLLKKIESGIPDNIFLRIHKQYIINIKFISHIGRDTTGSHCVYLNDDDDTRLPVGRIYWAADVKRKLKSLAEL